MYKIYSTLLYSPSIQTDHKVLSVAPNLHMVGNGKNFLSRLTHPALLCFMRFSLSQEMRYGDMFLLVCHFLSWPCYCHPSLFFSFVTYQWQRHLIRDCRQNASTLHLALKRARGTDGTPMTQPCTITIPL